MLVYSLFVAAATRLVPKKGWRYALGVPVAVIAGAALFDLGLLTAMQGPAFQDEWGCIPSVSSVT